MGVAIHPTITRTEPAAAAIDLRTLPTLRQAKKFFPKVTRQVRQGYSTLTTSFPRCADGGVEPGADPEHLWTAGYYRPDAGKRVLMPSVDLYEFATLEQAELVMARLKEHVSACAGLHTGSEDYSRFTPVTAPSTLGEDRIAFMWSQAYEFEGGVNRSHEVWARVGNIVTVTSASREKGRIPAAPTNALARIVVSRAG